MVLPSLHLNNLWKKSSMNKFKSLLIGCVAVGVAMAGSAAMALSTEATTAVTAVGADVTAAETLVWPVIGAAIVAGIGIKLVKRFANKI